MIQKYFNGAVRQQIRQGASQFGVKGQEAEVLQTTKTAIKEVLQAELKNGHYNEVVILLKSAVLKTGGKLFFDKIIQRVVGQLMVRFGLPQAVAFSLATLLVPFILKHLGLKALKSGKVQDLLQSLGVRDHLDKLTILSQQLKDKFSHKEKTAA